ncbi:hypothetical protein Hamer_G002163 [Homarus americanus]|uniref:Uncharacterized protein n=1 Tax=Homarus americanus TaxID=6706 RepID=A0A8J5JVH7_HOMAM|nr:hypothetical protein Hamer_G002163 [Homarus americanus]
MEMTLFPNSTGSNVTTSISPPVNGNNSDIQVWPLWASLLPGALILLLLVLVVASLNKISRSVSRPATPSTPLLREEQDDDDWENLSLRDIAACTLSHCCKGG